MIGKHLNKRYLIESELGKGGMGVVYRAFDQLLERDVAVKLLSRHKLGSDGRTQLLHEARAAASLNHPNITTIFDVGETQKQPFIVMELVEGTPLSNYQPAGITGIINMTRQICLALDHAHNKGIIHRDIKPENILIAKNQTVKLMDFGLARSIASRLSQEDGLVGTVFYISPEQAMGEEIDQRSDLYSLGVVLYELVTGKLPFKADDPIAVVSQHLYAPLVPPRVHTPQIPGGLNNLIVHMLSKQAKDRPKNAAEILAALDTILDKQTGQLYSPTPMPLERIVRGRLIGREPELDMLRLLWREVQNGEGKVLLISGESGIGKTRLVRELMAQVEVSGGKAIMGSAYSESNMPYGPFAQMIRKIKLNGSGKGLDLPPFIISDLLTIAPDMRLYYPNIPENPALDPLSEKQRLFENMVILCKTITEKTPLLMFLDDAHWADAATLALFRHLARRTRNQRMLIVSTYREHELRDELPFHQVLLDLQRERLITRMKLTRLDLEGTRQMLAALFDEDLSAQIVTAVYHETEGNPFFIEEVSKSLVDNKKLIFENQHWRLAGNTELQIPQSIRIAIQSRVHKMPDEIQDTLRLAAIFGRVFDFATLAAASPYDENTLINAIEQATEAQLLEELETRGTETFSFAHALIPATLREEMSGLRRRRMHLQAASVIENLRPDDFESLAHHFLKAEVLDKALKFLEKAGDRARTSYANENAIRFYTHALEIAEKNSDIQFRLLAKRTDVYSLMALRDCQYDDVEEMLSLASTLKNDHYRIEALLALTDFHIATDPHKAGEPAKEALEIAVQFGDVLLEGRARQRVGQAAWYMSNNQESKIHLETALECFQKNDKSAEMAETLHMLSLTYLELNQMKSALRSVKEAIATSRKIGNRRQEAISLRRLAIIYRSLNELEKALTYAQEALSLHQELGDRTQELHAHNVIGLLHAGLDHLEDAKTSLNKSLEIAWDIESSFGISTAISNAIHLGYYASGSLEEALNFINQELEKAEATQYTWLMQRLYDYKLDLLYIIGQYEMASEVAEKITQLDAFKTSEDRAAFQILIDQIRLSEGESSNEISLEPVRDLLTGQAGVDDIRFGYANRFALTSLRSGTPENMEIALAGLETNAKWLKKSSDPTKMVETNGFMASLLLALGKLEAALALSEQTVVVLENLRKNNHILAHLFLLTHARILAASGKQQESIPYLHKAYDILMQTAQKFKNEAFRKNWLLVPENQEIIHWISDIKKAN